MMDTPKASKPALRVINVDKNAAYPKAIADLKAMGALLESVELRQVKYLNNIIEQDHRAHQTMRQTGAGLLFVRDGMANLARIRGHTHAQERAMRGVEKGDILGQVTFIATLFGVVA